jgi:hypothetical protein
MQDDLHFGRSLRAGLFAHTAQALATWPVSASTPNAEAV